MLIILILSLLVNVTFYCFPPLLASVVKNNTFNASLDQFPYPFPVKKFGFSSQRQKLEMAYMTLGQKDSSKSVVLLHGKNFASYYWEQIAKDLEKRGYFVIMPDQIGFGKSSKPKSYQYSFAQFVINTKNLVEQLGVKSYDVVGHSMGGMLATHMAARLNTVKRLILINPIGLEDYRLYTRFQDPEFFFANEFKKTVKQFRNYQKKNYYDGQWNSAYEQLLVPFKGWRIGTDWELIAWNNALTYGPIFTEPITGLLASLKKDVVLINGTRDRTAPGRSWMRDGVKRELGRYDRLGKEVQALNSRVKLWELEGLGHMPQFEDYGAFSKIFLQVLK